MSETYSGASFFASARLLTSLTAFVTRRQSTSQVVHRHEKLAPESGVEVMAPISVLSEA